MMIGFVSEGDRPRFAGFSGFNVATVSSVLVMLRAVAVRSRVIGNLMTVILRTSVSDSRWSVPRRLIVRSVSASKARAVKLRLAELEYSDHSRYYNG